MSCTVILIICFLMNYLEQTKGSLTLSTIPEIAVRGTDFSFICLYGNKIGKYITFEYENKSVCVISGFKENDTCDISGTHVENFKYTCDQLTYTVTIPGSLLTENLHLSKWKCYDTVYTDTKSNIKTLYINVPINLVTLSNTPPEENPVKVIQGENKTFTCRTGSGRPSSRIQWFLSGVNITSFATPQLHECATDCMDEQKISSNQLIYKGNKEDSGKIIYCTAFNIAEYVVRSINKTIDVLYSPSTPSITQTPPGAVDENTTITLFCEIKGGNPLANITWQCEGSPPIESTGILESNDTSILSFELIATKENNGKLCNCIGSHPAWRQRNSTSHVLDIRYVPALPSITQQPSGPIIEGNNVVLTCEIYGGNPLANITWICEEFTHNTPTDNIFGDTVFSSIELEVTKENDGKKCICRGHHPLWENDKERRQTITVYFSPDKFLTIIQKPDSSVDVGSRITLRCEVAGGKPLADIIWQCDTSSLVHPTVIPPTDTSVASIQLRAIKQHNGQNCTCIGSHPAWIHNISSSIQLRVNYPPESFPNITQRTGEPIIEYNNAILTCEVIGGNPLATIDWQCYGFKPVEPSGTLLTGKVVSSIERNVTKEDNGKICICTGHHRLWTPEKRTTRHTLEVYYSSMVQILNTQPVNVVENRTMVLVCSEVDGNPRNASFLWYKSSSIIGRTPNYSIATVNVNNAGNYTCQGSNGIGRASEAIIEMHVLYSPRVSALSALYGSTIAENDTAVLQCTVQSNPPSRMVWIKNGTNTILHSNGNLFQSNLTFENANCFDTNNYTCKATNSINDVEYTTSKDIELFVSCFPRRYKQDDGSINPIGLAVGQDLIISDHILAYPIFNITWFFKQDRNLSETMTLSASDCSIYNIFDHQICFSKLNLTENDFGFYSAVIVNDQGKTTLTYTVNPQGKPYKSTNLNVTCGILKAEVSWRTGYNGGQHQRFHIITTDKDGFQLLYDTGIVGRNKGETKMYSLAMPAGPFSFEVFGNNSFGNATVKGAACKVQGLTESDSVIGLAAGLGSCLAVVLIIIVTVVILCRKRFPNKNDSDGKLFNRLEKSSIEDDDDELKDNPMYVTSDINSGAENGPVYSTVDKTKTTKLQEPVAFQLGLQGPVYSEVNKTGKKVLPKDKKDELESRMKMQRKEKKGKHSKDIEMGNVYGNTQMTLQDNHEEDVYANAESKSDSKNNIGTVYMPKKNKDGLIYADLELDPSTSGKKFVIRGLENRTNYAIIDVNVKVDPLPSDDDDDEDKEIQTD